MPEILCPHCLEIIADGSETATVHNGDDRYPDQIMHTDCAADGYRDAYPITWPNGETTDEVAA